MLRTATILGLLLVMCGCETTYYYGGGSHTMSIAPSGDHGIYGSVDFEGATTADFPAQKGLEGLGCLSFFSAGQNFGSKTDLHLCGEGAFTSTLVADCALSELYVTTEGPGITVRLSGVDDMDDAMGTEGQILEAPLPFRAFAAGSAVIEGVLLQGDCGQDSEMTTLPHTVTLDWDFESQVINPNLQ